MKPFLVALTFVIVVVRPSWPQIAAANSQGTSTCSGQAKSISELRGAFRTAKAPKATDLTGTWVAIGFFGAYPNTAAEVNCAGLNRGDRFEQALFIKADVAIPRFVGATGEERVIRRDRQGSVIFDVDFGGDAGPSYRCRLSPRGTFLCLIDVYGQGVEFKRAPIDPERLCQIDSASGFCSSQ